MSTLSELIHTTGDEAKEELKKGLLDLIKQAKAETKDVIKETGEKIEKWSIMKIKGELDVQEFESLLYARDRTVRQFLNSQQIAARAKLEKISVGLIDLVLNKALDKIL